MTRSLHPIFGYPTDLVRFSWGTTKTIFKEEPKVINVEWYVPSVVSHVRIHNTLVGHVMKRSLMEKIFDPISVVMVCTSSRASNLIDLIGKQPKRKKRFDYFLKRKMKHLEDISEL